MISVFVANVVLKTTPSRALGFLFCDARLVVAAIDLTGDVGAAA